jgi:hypothetical protein
VGLLTTERIHRPIRIFLVLSVCAAWVLISIAPLWKYLSHLEACAALVFGMVSIAAGMRWLQRRSLRGRRLSLGWFVLLYLLLAMAIALLYPLSLRHTLNRGSDREDALRIELNAVRRGQYPYDARTYLGNPPTPLPGAMLLAAPFYAIGHIAWQNFVWLALFFGFVVRFFRRRETALFFLVLFLLLAPSNLNDLSSGGDYIVNFFYAAIAGGLVLKSLDRTRTARVAAAICFGLALSSRIVYVFLAIPVLMLVWQRSERWRASVITAVVCAAWCGITLPIFAPHPVARLLRQLSENGGKLRHLPAALHPQWTLTALALGIACASAFVRMNRTRVFLIFGCSSFVILAPPGLSIAFAERRMPFEFSYLAISVLAFVLWALSRYESATMGGGEREPQRLR